ncbi:hypothetical protein AB0O16_03600 [Microbacterium sp. NPDC089180]|uniref:RNA polymerase sigma factor n=1 Tax=unclassified Microbacterium TaxID=2609290 RepID=UPI003430B089
MTTAPVTRDQRFASEHWCELPTTDRTIQIENVSDGEIITRSLKDRATFVELYDRYERLVYRYTARRLGLSWADDITSETFLVAFSRRDDFVVGIPGWRGGADPAAASVFECAASATLNFSDLIVAPGQFLLIETQGVYLTQGSVTGDVENFHEELYIPGDRKDDWVWVRHLSAPPQGPGSTSEAPTSETAQTSPDQIISASHGHRSPARWCGRKP